MNSYEHWSLIWQFIQAIATATTCAVVITAAIFTYRQVREASRARKLEGALAVLTHVSSPELRNARRLVYTTTRKSTTQFNQIRRGKNSMPSSREYLRMRSTSRVFIRTWLLWRTSRYLFCMTWLLMTLSRCTLQELHRSIGKLSEDSLTSCESAMARTTSCSTLKCSTRLWLKKD